MSLVSTLSNGALPGKSRQRLELWPSDWVSARRSKEFEPDVVRIIAAGSLIRVDGLEYNYTFAIPPVPGDTQLLQAFGTVVSGSARWTHVRLPEDRRAKWSQVQGTYVFAFPPDARLLERLPGEHGFGNIAVSPW